MLVLNQCSKNIESDLTYSFSKYLLKSYKEVFQGRGGGTAIHERARVTASWSLPLGKGRD